jgi:hypothetical protein
MYPDESQATPYPAEPEHTRSNASQRSATDMGEVGRSQALSSSEQVPINSSPSDQSLVGLKANETNNATVSSPDEPSRSDPTERVEPRPVAAEHDVTRTDAIERDEPSGDGNDELIEPEISWLDVEQAAELLKERGISRTIRTIQKMCKREDLVAKLVPTENGVRYIISDISIDDFVERHNQKMPSGGFASKPLDDEENGGVETVGTKAADEATSTASLDQAGAEAHFKEIVGLKDQHIALLESQLAAANGQIAVKDEQIATMHERDHETNILIQNLQGLVALPERRSETPPPTNARTSAIDVDHRPGSTSPQP